MLEHGGGIRRAAARFGIPVAEWLDLSTGINPLGWPVPDGPPASRWSRLPEEGDGLETAAAGYYGITDLLLPLAGSQAAIQALPRLRPPGRVAVVSPAYAEHAHAWSTAGHRVEAVSVERPETGLESIDVVVVVNPNNPTGRLLASERLLSWHRRLAERGGWLVIDEAFMDVTPQHSSIGAVGQPGLIVLRSLGKFFGLAGARVGFAFAEKALLDRLRELLGPWTLPGPSRWLAQRALEDGVWQQRTRQALPLASERLAALLTDHGWPPSGGTALFQWLPMAGAGTLWQRLAERGILVRHFSQPSALRFGLPGPEADWWRLAKALELNRGPSL